MTSFVQCYIMNVGESRGVAVIDAAHAFALQLGHMNQLINDIQFAIIRSAIDYGFKSRHRRTAERR